MGEAILGRASASIISKFHGDNSGLKTEIFTSNSLWIAPEAVNQTFHVRIFGGGGSACSVNNYNSGNSNQNIYLASGSRVCGGGGGYMNNADLIIPVNTKVPIIIGDGGGEYETIDIWRSSPSTEITSTKIVVYPSSGGTTSFGTYLSAAGGDKAHFNINSRGGNGGSGGGGEYYTGVGGKGDQFGGGGGHNGGNGGT